MGATVRNEYVLLGLFLCFDCPCEVGLCSMDPNNSAVPAPFFDLYTIHFLLEVVQVFDFFSVYNDFIIFFTQSSFSLSLRHPSPRDRGWALLSLPPSPLPLPLP